MVSANKSQILVILWVLFMAPLLTNCAGQPAFITLSTEEFSMQGASSLPADFAKIRKDVFLPRCLTCHAEFGTYEGLVATGFVIAGNASSSPLYIQIANGNMPAGGPVLPSEQVQMLREWINAGAPEIVITATPTPSPTPSATPKPTPTPSPTPAPTPTPTPPPAATAPTFTMIKNSIITPSCVGCHGGSSPSANVNLSTYAKVLEVVRAGDAANSAFYSSVLNDRMPRSGSKLTTTQKNNLRDWIDAGALNN